MADKGTKADHKSSTWAPVGVLNLVNWETTYINPAQWLPPGFKRVLSPKVGSAESE